MPCHIGQGFLTDAEQCGCKLAAAVQILDPFIDAADLGALLKIFCQPFDRRNRTEGIEDTRTQLGGDTPDIPDSRVHQARQLAEPFQQRADGFRARQGFPQAVPQIDQVESHGRQLLAQLVMDLPRDVRAFLFLNRLQTRRKGAQPAHHLFVLFGSQLPLGHALP